MPSCAKVAHRNAPGAWQPRSLGAPTSGRGASCLSSLQPGPKSLTQPELSSTLPPPCPVRVCAGTEQVFVVVDAALEIPSLMFAPMTCAVKAHGGQFGRMVERRSRTDMELEAHRKLRKTGLDDCLRPDLQAENPTLTWLTTPQYGEVPSRCLSFIGA